MSEWYERRYPVLPKPVPVKGFPRPLFPPDAKAHGKVPSVDGPDVVAYKRVVSRAGRWPWTTFSDDFVNAFAHGRKGGNVGTSGLAGIQRQHQLDATGWLGVKVFNLLRSIVIPEGLPNAGKPAMDKTAVDLINKAFAQFQGHEPLPEGTIRQAALTRAIKQLGTKESPFGSNRQAFGEWYGMNGVPWCAMFATWCYVLGAADIGKTSPAMKRGSYYSYVPYIVGDARANKNRLISTGEPLPGDLVCFDWESNGTYDHVGIFEKWTTAPVEFQTIEGNTSLSNQSNGGEVMRRTRSRRGQTTMFVRVGEAA